MQKLNMGEEFEKPQKKPSRWWYLLPIFLSVVGGVIGYFLLKDRDRKFAERLLIIGLVMIAVLWVLNIVLSSLAYMYISGYFTERTSVILSISDSECTSSEIRVFVRNDGTSASLAVKISVDGNQVSCNPTIGYISSGDTEQCTITRGNGVADDAGYHTLKAETSGISSRGSVYCGSAAT